MSISRNNHYWLQMASRETWMLFLIVITLHLGETLDTSTVVRENYGVVFAPKSILDNTHSVWHHTFAFELPQITLPDIEQPCSEDEFDEGALSASAET